MARTDRAERLIDASPEVIFKALSEAEAIAAWRAPEGMYGEVHRFDFRPGGEYHMTLHYEAAGGGVGKSAQQEDSFEGRFTAIEEDRRIVEEVRFHSPDPAFASPMIVETVLEACPGGTRVSMSFHNVSDAISAEDHQVGIASALQNLARFVEQV